MTRFLVLALALTGCMFDVQTMHGHRTATGGGGGPALRRGGNAPIVRDTDADDPRARRFIQGCQADYQDFRARWKPLETKHRARFAEIKKLSTYYARRDALLALANDVVADAKTLNLGGATWVFELKAGFAHELEVYLAEENRARGITEPVHLLDTYYPTFPDDTVAGDAYCARAVQDGTHRTQSLSWLHMSEVLPPARATALEAYLHDMEKRSQKELAVAPSPPKYLHAIDLASEVGHHSEIANGTELSAGGVVKSIKRDGGSVAIRASVPMGATAQHDCVETNRVDKIRPDGTVEYRENCQFTSTTTDIVFDLHFPDAPADLKVGDWLEFTAIVTKTATGKAQARTGAPASFTFTLDGKLVRQVARAKKPGDRTEQFAVVSQY